MLKLVPVLLVHERQRMLGQRQVHQRRDAQELHGEGALHRDGQQLRWDALPADEPRNSNVRAHLFLREGQLQRRRLVGRHVQRGGYRVLVHE
jgi:hypothetical protein